jgi:hypothetical protein
MMSFNEQTLAEREGKPGAPTGPGVGGGVAATRGRTISTRMFAGSVTCCVVVPVVAAQLKLNPATGPLFYRVGVLSGMTAVSVIA